MAKLDDRPATSHTWQGQSGPSIPPAPPKEPSAIDRALAELSHKVNCLEEAWQVLSEKLEPVLVPQPPAVSAPEPAEYKPMCQLESEIARQIERISSIRLSIYQVASRVQL